MVIGQFCDHTTTGRPLDEALHNEEGLIDLFDSTCILADGCGDSGDAHRTALELVDDGQQDLVVNLVQTVFVDVQGRQGYLCDLLAIRGVPLERPAISKAASSVMGTARILAERSIIFCSVSGS